MSIATDEKFTFELKTKITKGVLENSGSRYVLDTPRLFINDKKQGVVIASNGKGLAITGHETIDATKQDLPIPLAILPTKKNNRTVTVSGNGDIRFECQNKVDTAPYSDVESKYPKIDSVIHQWDNDLPTITLDAKLLLSVVEAIVPVGSDTKVTIQLDGNNGIKVVHSDGGIGAVMPCTNDGYKPGEVYEATRSVVNSYYND